MSISTHFPQSFVPSVVLRILVDRLTTLLRRAFSSGLFQMQNTQRHGTYAILYYSTAHNSLWRLLLYIFPSFQNCARCEKDLKDNKDNSIHLARKYARIFVLGHCLRFSSSYALRKLFASRNRYCPRTNIPAYFRAKWRLLFI